MLEYADPSRPEGTIIGELQVTSVLNLKDTLGRHQISKEYMHCIDEAHCQTCCCNGAKQEIQPALGYVHFFKATSAATSGWGADKSSDLLLLSPTLTLPLENPPIKYAQSHQPNWKRTLPRPATVTNQFKFGSMMEHTLWTNRCLSSAVFQCAWPWPLAYSKLCAKRGTLVMVIQLDLVQWRLLPLPLLEALWKLKIKVTSKSTFFWTLTDSASALGFLIM